MWLPLAAKHPFILSPPIDIAWVWHCHLLSPRAYDADCQRMFGRTIDHRLYSSQRSNLKSSEELWNNAYPNEPFDVSVDGTDIELCDFHSSLSSDIESVVGRQKLFYHQVKLQHHTNKTFVRKSIERYKEYLYLLKKYPNTILVPCYDMVIVWRVHMLHPLMYKQETEAILGEHLDHDDSFYDKSFGSNVGKRTIDTRKLWHQTFNQEYFRFGCMFRGECMNEKFGTLSHINLSKMATKNVRIIFKSISIPKKSIEICAKNVRQLKLIHYQDDDEHHSSTLLVRLKRPNRNDKDSDAICWNCESQGGDILGCNMGHLKLEIETKPRILRTLCGKIPLISGIFPYEKLISHVERTDVVYNKVIIVAMSDGSHAIIELAVKLLYTRPLGFLLQNHIPKSVVYRFRSIADYTKGNFWGPIPIQFPSNTEINATRTVMK